MFNIFLMLFLFIYPVAMQEAWAAEHIDVGDNIEPRLRQAKELIFVLPDSALEAQGSLIKALKKTYEKDIEGKIEAIDFTKKVSIKTLYGNVDSQMYPPPSLESGAQITDLNTFCEYVERLQAQYERNFTPEFEGWEVLQTADENTVTNKENGLRRINWNEAQIQDLHKYLYFKNRLDFAINRQVSKTFALYFLTNIANRSCFSIFPIGRAALTPIRAVDKEKVGFHAAVSRFQCLVVKDSHTGISFIMSLGGHNGTYHKVFSYEKQEWTTRMIKNSLEAGPNDYQGPIEEVPVDVLYPSTSKKGASFLQGYFNTGDNKEAQQKDIWFSNIKEFSSQDDSLEKLFTILNEIIEKTTDEVEDYLSKNKSEKLRSRISRTVGSITGEMQDGFGKLKETIRSF